MPRSVAYCLVLGVFLLAAPSSAQEDLAGDSAVDTSSDDRVDDADETEDHDGALSTEVSEEDTDEEEASDSPEEEEESVWSNEQISSDQMRSLHKKVDANEDGKVSLAEVMDFAKQARHAIVAKETEHLLNDLDNDQDGKVSLDELLEGNFGPELPDDNLPPPTDADQAAEDEKIKAEKELEKEKFKIADKNGDGFLDQNELPAAYYPETHDGVLALTAAAALKAKDKDGDGELSLSEVWEDEDEDLDEAEQADKKADFEKLDVDKNGKLNLDEFKQWESGHFHTSDAMNSLFEVADEDKDDQLTIDEVDSARPLLANTMADTHFQEWVRHYDL